jgi:hypothetical protein
MTDAACGEAFVDTVRCHEIVGGISYAARSRYSQPLRLNHTNGMIAVISMSASAYG